MLCSVSVKVVQTHNKNPVSLHRTHAHTKSNQLSTFLSTQFTYSVRWVNVELSAQIEYFVWDICCCSCFWFVYVCHLKSSNIEYCFFPFDLIRMKRMHWIKWFIKANMRTEFNIWFAAIQLGMNSDCYWIAMFFFDFKLLMRASHLLKNVCKIIIEAILSYNKSTKFFASWSIKIHFPQIICADVMTLDLVCVVL